MDSPTFPALVATSVPVFGEKVELQDAGNRMWDIISWQGIVEAHADESSGRRRAALGASVGDGRERGLHSPEPRT